jgi:hypothetical protein
VIQERLGRRDGPIELPVGPIAILEHPEDRALLY